MADDLFIIEKMTQTYDAAQDRISLDMQDAAGKVLRLWLTRRLADALFGRLCGWVDATKSDCDVRFRRHLQTWAQQAAQAQMRNDVPVRWRGVEALIREIDIDRKVGALQLTFKCPDAPPAQVRLSDTHLRQWLGVLCRLYAAAAWPMTPWPAWLIEAQSAPIDSSPPAGAPH